jgi:hypothetical protein
VACAEVLTKKFGKISLERIKKRDKIGLSDLFAGTANRRLEQLEKN